MPFPSLGDLPDPGIEPTSLRSPALTDGFFTTEPTVVVVVVVVVEDDDDAENLMTG